jgi:hypothetical protein
MLLKFTLGDRDAARGAVEQNGARRSRALIDSKTWSARPTNRP